MHRLAALVVTLSWSVSVHSHHWVKDVYDAGTRFIVEVEVRQFRLINPHPHLFVEIMAIAGDGETGGLEAGQTWTLEMDNKRELTALGFHEETFVPGDRITAVVNPARTTLYRENTLYLRAVEHTREGFIYLHNVRQLFPVEPGENNLARYLNEIN